MRPLPPLNAYLVCDDAARAIEFYRQAFDGEELYRLKSGPGGTIGHAEISINGSIIMVADEFPGMNTAPKSLGGRTSQMVMLVEDADAVFAKAIAAGGRAVHAPRDEFYGYRMAVVADPGGHHWMIQHKIADIAPEEMQRRWDELLAAGEGCGEVKP